MSTKKNKIHPDAEKKDIDRNHFDPTFSYPMAEDIYSQSEQETEIDPEDISQKKTPNEPDPDAANEKDYNNEKTGDDLDVPGSEDQEDDKRNGKEDEENEYFSLGG